MHLLLSDGLSKELEVYPGTDLQLKISIKDRSLPLTMTFVYPDDKSKNVTCMWSTEVKLPRENDSSTTVQHNVSAYISLFDFFLAT